MASRCIRVIAQFDCHQAAFFEGFAVMEGSEGGLQGRNDTARSPDFRRVFPLEGDGGNFGDFRH